VPLSKCRYCGKKVPNIFHKYHEQVSCLVMRKKRGDVDMIMRELPKVQDQPEPVDKGQKRLFEVCQPA
jgi:hypothetical protein